MSKTKTPSVAKWKTATIANGLDKDKFRFPRVQGLPLARPVVIRNTSNTKKRVVAPSYMETMGASQAINTSDDIFEKLGLTGTLGTVEYGTATFCDILRAKKWILIVSILTCVLAVVALVATVAAFYPGELIAEIVTWVAAIVGGVVAVAICAISVRSAYKET